MQLFPSIMLLCIILLLLKNILIGIKNIWFQKIALVFIEEFVWVRMKPEGCRSMNTDTLKTIKLFDLHLPIFWLWVYLLNDTKQVEHTELDFFIKGNAPLFVSMLNIRKSSRKSQNIHHVTFKTPAPK
jgi:hypothetical protein